MSDLSVRHCEKCKRPEYDCECDEHCCVDCGCELDKKTIEAGRDMCFDCYCFHQD